MSSPSAALAIDLASVLLGAGLGLGIGAWQQARLRSRLRQVLSPLLADEVQIPLGLESLVRRGVVSALDREAALEAQLTIWEQSLQAAPVAFFWVDADDGLRWCNDRARELFGIRQWQPDHDRLLIEVVRSYDLDRLVQQTRQRRSPYQREWNFYPDTYPSDYVSEPGASAGGAMVDAGASTEPRAIGTPIPTEIGSGGMALRGWGLPLERGHVAVFVENCQQLVDLARSRNRWTNDLAHELRTPLTSIQLVFETLQQQLDPPLRHWVDRGMPEVKRLVQFVQDWLDLSQMEQNPGQILRLEVLDLAEVAQAAWQSVEPLAERKSIHLCLQQPPDDPLWLEGDRAKLHRLLLNLLDNAVKYSPAGGKIWLNLSREALSDEALNDDRDAPPPRAYVDIIDQGPGFAPADLPHIFERLYRGDSSRTRETDAMIAGNFPNTGSGLGLAIARQIAIAHGGHITGSNDPLTGGARLRVNLPIRAGTR